MILLVALYLIHLTALDGQTIHVNPERIISLRTPHRNPSDPDRLIHGNAHCVVSLENGKFISVVETCAEVSRRAGGEREHK